MWKQSIRLILGVIIVLGMITAAIAESNYESVWSTLRQADLVLLGLAMASITLNNCAKAWRWKLLLGKHGSHIPFWRLLHLHLTGQLLNQFLPARAGDLSRLYLSGELGVKTGFGLGSLALEKLVDSIIYILIGILLLFLIPSSLWKDLSLFTTNFTLFLILFIIITSFHFRRHTFATLRWLMRQLPLPLYLHASRIISDGMRSLQLLARPQFAIRIALVSAIIWFTAVLTNELVLRALEIEAPLVASIFVLFVLLAGINVAPVPGQIGVFQYLCILSLGVFHVDPVDALSFGITLHLLILTPMLLAGFATLLSLKLNTLAFLKGKDVSAQQRQQEVS